MLGIETNVTGQAAVMGGDRFFPQHFAEAKRDSLGEAASVHEHQSAPMRLDQLHHALIDFPPLLVGANGGQLAWRDFERQVKLADVAGVDDLAGHPVLSSSVPLCLCVRFRFSPYEKRRNLLHRLLRGGKADACGRRIAERGEAFQRKREMAAPFVAGQGVNLIDNDGLHRPQLLAELGRGEQEVE